MSDGDKHIDPHCAAMAAKYPGFRVIGSMRGGTGPVTKTIYPTPEAALKACRRLQKSPTYERDCLCINYHWPYALRSAGHSSASN